MVICGKKIQKTQITKTGLRSIQIKSVKNLWSLVTVCSKIIQKPQSCTDKHSLNTFSAAGIEQSNAQGAGIESFSLLSLPVLAGKHIPWPLTYIFHSDRNFLNVRPPGYNKKGADANLF